VRLTGLRSPLLQTKRCLPFTALVRGPYAVAPAVALTAVMISFVATFGCETIEA
jgi:hypothetical protein